MACLKLSSDHVIRSVGVVFVMVSLQWGQTCAATVSTGWGYKKGHTIGPDKWYNKYPDCGGVMQSPININTNQVVFDGSLDLLDFSDYAITDDVDLKLENVAGHTAEVALGGAKDLYLREGSLPDSYKLNQLHFHWGPNQSRGSEHSVNGMFAPLEVHFVHTQRRFSSMASASTRPFGLAVVSFLFKIGNHNPHYETLINSLKLIPNAYDEVELPTFPIKGLIPKGPIHYFRYQGSLTTPPCSESVIWTVAIPKIEISEDQLSKFRELLDEDNENILNDFRPIQAINQRTVLTTMNAYLGEYYHDDYNYTDDY